MRRECQNFARDYFGYETHDLVPYVEHVRLRTITGLYAQTLSGTEKTWKALWDTGSPLTIVPHFNFILQVKLRAINRLKKALRSYDCTARDGIPWYDLLIEIPGLPWLKVRAIAPDDSDPKLDRRTHITLGRDVISRLVIGCSSNVPWDDAVASSGQSKGICRYRRSCRDRVRHLR